MSDVEQPQEALPETPTEAEITPEAVRALVESLRDAEDPTAALAELNELADWRVHGKVVDAVVSVAEALVERVMAQGEATPAAQAHMVILLAALLPSGKCSGAVDRLFVRWVRHAGTFGPARATPPAFQHEAFVQRMADLVGWGDLEVARDRDGLQRFLAWVNGWALKNRFRVRRTLDTLRRNFPAPGLWEAVTFKG
ncbi:MAG: hypothetical protein HY909_10850 [Deltaproteobacteria bacterium]|nr:hypothetical protein [Deltaproteobacteria bacterium]